MTHYRILLQGHLDTRWEAVFTDFAIEHQITPQGEPVTVMTGAVTDQAALYGVIARLRNLGVELISVQPQYKE